MKLMNENRYDNPTNKNKNYTLSIFPEKMAAALRFRCGFRGAIRYGISKNLAPISTARIIVTSRYIDNSGELIFVTSFLIYEIYCFYTNPRSPFEVTFLLKTGSTKTLKDILVRSRKA